MPKSHVNVKRKLTSYKERYASSDICLAIATGLYETWQGIAATPPSPTPL